jgi:plasmid replication initiation protein
MEMIPIKKFRELVGVPPAAYERGDNFMRFVIKPALLEINGLSDMGVRVNLVRKHARAPIDAVEIEWWKKRGDEFRAAIEERNRSKVGRMARLKAQAQKSLTSVVEAL